MPRQLLVSIALLLLLATPLLIQGCSDDNPVEPLPPTRATIIQPTADDTTLFADEPVQLEGSGTMTTGQPVFPNRLSWYLGSYAVENLIGTGTRQTIELATGQHTVLLVAQESINLADTARVTFTVREPANWAPVATILEPIDGENYLPAHVPTVLRGLATDVEDGHLDGEQVVWTSDLQANLGEGAELEVALIPGTHVIAMRATDSGGEVDTDTVTVIAPHRPAAPVTSGEYFFRADNFTQLCGDKEITQLIGDGTLVVDGATAELTIAELAGSLTCETADVCLLPGESTQGNVRVAATGDAVGGGTVRLEFSLFTSTPTTLEGLVRGIEAPAGNPVCVYRGYVRFIAKTD